MKDKKIINIILSHIENKGNIDLEVLIKIINSKSISYSQMNLLYKNIINKIKKDELIIEYSSESIDKKAILKEFNNPTVYNFIKNTSLIGGLKIKKDWSIIDTSIKEKLNKINTINLK
jgi:hypothetical protein